MAEDMNIDKNDIMQPENMVESDATVTTEQQAIVEKPKNKTGKRILLLFLVILYIILFSIEKRTKK